MSLPMDQPAEFYFNIIVEMNKKIKLQQDLIDKKDAQIADLYCKYFQIEVETKGEPENDHSYEDQKVA